jgi:hypothetical protein
VDMVSWANRSGRRMPGRPLDRSLCDDHIQVLCT